jgi:hypothetical protein
MRDLNELNKYRVTDPKLLGHFGGWAGDATCGSFTIASPIDGRVLRVIAANGEGWDHVSVSLEKRAPNWREMSLIHRMFFRDDEVAMQLHVPPKDHINVHPNVLHIWRPHDQAIPLPPKIFV